MPQAIFASLTADWQQAEESLAAKRYESVLDILASDSSILSAYLALLLDKLDGALPLPPFPTTTSVLTFLAFRLGNVGQRDQVLHLVLSLVLESRLQPMFAAADIRSRLQPLASALLQVRCATFRGSQRDLTHTTFLTSIVPGARGRR
jgi:hypothetical protein